MATSTAQKQDGKRPTIVIPWQRKLLYASIVLLGFLGLFELSLRTLSLGRPPIVGQLRFGYDTGIPIYDSDGIENEGEVFRDHPLFEQDNVLFWKAIPNTPFTGPRGFRLPEPSDQRPSPESITLAVLGDSCSFLGKRPFPARLPELLKSDEPELVRVYNASCPGYTTQQGVAQLDMIERLEPDVVVVYFGWNDHWNSLNGSSDRELFERTALARQTQSVLGAYNTYWIARSLFAARPTPGPQTASTVRVPLIDYQQNIRIMAERFQRWDCKAVFVTAPSAFVEGRLPDWASPFFAQYYNMTPQQVTDIPKTHERYNQTLRDVAVHFENCTVCDLDAVFKNQPALFRSDCIHLSELGHQQAAQSVADTIRQQCSSKFGSGLR